jgi:hypothetical protein
MSIKTPVRVTGPRAVLSAIPSLLGFRPSNSIVALVTRGGIVAVTIRFDLPSNAEERAYVARTTRDAADKTSADAYLLVTYAADKATAAVASVVVQDPVLAELRCSDDLWVVGSEAGSWMCEGKCCPFPVPDPSDDLMLEDGAPLTDRETLRAALSHCESDRERFVPAPHTVDRRMIAAVTKRLTSGDPRDVTPTIGDYFMAICTLDPSRQWDKRDRLIVDVGRKASKATIQTLAQHTPDDEVDSLAVLALFAYLSGDGASSLILLNRIGEARSSLAGIVRTCLVEAVPPGDMLATLSGAPLRY